MLDGMRSAFEELCLKAADHIARHQMLAPGARVLVAVSGGPDSVALFHVLQILGYHLEVAHLDHGTRDGASAEDAEFVVSLAAGWELPCRRVQRDVQREAAERGLSFEQHARAVRYAFFEHTALGSGCDAIATGHQADDQAETVLLRVLRGCGPQALSGIPPVRTDLAVPVVRPLLTCPRALILRALDEEDWIYRVDATNADTRFPRNRVRHELMPLLRTFNPKAERALCRLAQVQYVENDYQEPEEAAALAQVAGGGERISRAAFRGLHPALGRRVLRRFLYAHGLTPDYGRVVHAADHIIGDGTGKHCEVCRGYGFYIGREHAELVGPAHAAAPAGDGLSVALPLPGSADALGCTFAAGYLDAAPENPADYCGPARQVFDESRIAGALAIRTRRPGDRFSPLGMRGSRKLKDFFIDVGMPRPRRDRHPLLVDDAGILWVVGYAVDGRAAVGPDTELAVEVTATPAPETGHHATE
jgi:tRNA(Ile)-lysidine synthase